MIDFSSTVVELSGDSENKKKCRTLQSAFAHCIPHQSGAKRATENSESIQTYLSISRFRWQRDYMWLR